MSIRLPEYIDPVRLAENRRLLKGQISLRRMVRLSDILADKSRSEDTLVRDGDMVEVDLQFARAEAGLATVRGHLSTVVQMICQRCMQPMTQALDANVALAVVVNTKQAEQLPACYEPLLINQDADNKDNVSLTELIEDELILALPTVFLHDVKDCPAGNRFHAEQQDEWKGLTGNAIPVNTTNEDSGRGEKPNPFAVLAQLKSKPNN